MGIFDGGLGGVISGIFGALYPDAMLHPALRSETEGGSKITTYVGLDAPGRGIPAKAARSGVTWRMQQVEGYAPRNVAFSILTTCDGTGLPEPQVGWRITWPWPAGAVYVLEAPIDLDQAASHWTAMGRPL